MGKKELEQVLIKTEEMGSILIFCYSPVSRRLYVDIQCPTVQPVAQYWGH